MRNQTQSNNHYENTGNVYQSVDNSKAVTKNKNTTIINKGKAKIVIRLTVVLIILAAVIYGVNLFLNSTERKMIGTWQMSGNDSVYEFTSDHQMICLSGSNFGTNITYHVDNGRLRLDITFLWADISVFADIELDGNTLTLSNFIDPEHVFGFEADDKWIFTRIN